MADSPVSSSPNPIQLFKQQYPGYAKTSDAGVYKFLSDPVNFKKAFPGYAKTPDASISKWMQQFAPKTPIDQGLSTAPQSASQTAAQPGLLERGEQEASQLWNKYGAPTVKGLNTPIPGADTLFIGPTVLAKAGQQIAEQNVVPAGKGLPPKNNTPAWMQVIGGLAQLPHDVMSGMMTPANLGLMAAFMINPEAAGVMLGRRLMTGALAGKQALGAVQELQDGVKAAKRGDTETATRLLTGAGVSGLFAILSGVETVRPGKVVPGQPKEIDITKKAQVLERTPLAPQETGTQETVAPKPQTEAVKPVVPETKLATSAPKATPKPKSIIPPQVATPQTPAQKVEAIRQEVQSKAVAPPSKPQPATVRPAVSLTPEALARFNKIQSAGEAKATPVASPVRTSQFYPDEQAATELAKLEREHSEALTSSRIVAAQTEVNKLNHTLLRSGKGRVAEINDKQRAFLEGEKVKAERKLRSAQVDHIRQMSTAQKAQALIKFSNEAESKEKLGQALVAASKEKEAAPEWLTLFAEGVRTKNPQIRGTVLFNKLKQLKADIKTPEDTQNVQLVEKYLTTLHEAEQRLGHSIPVSTDLVHLRRLGQKFQSEGQFARQMANALKNKLGAKREKAAIGKEAAAPTPVTQSEITAASREVPEPQPDESLETLQEAEHGASAPIRGGAVSYDALVEKGFEAGATAEPELPNYLLENLNQPSLRNALHKDLLAKTPEAGHAYINKAFEGTPEDIARFNWPGPLKKVLDRYSEKMIPEAQAVEKTAEKAPENLSEKEKELLSQISVYEAGLANPDVIEPIRAAIPKRFGKEKALGRYLQALQKYVELDEDYDEKALAKAVAFAKRDTETGAVDLKGINNRDPLVVLKRARQAGLDAGLTASSKPPETAWISPLGPNQVWVKVDPSESNHLQTANVMAGTVLSREESRRMMELKGAARQKALKQNMQSMNDFLRDGWLRKSSPMSYEVRQFTKDTLHNVLDNFQKDLYLLRQFKDDPALFVASSTDLQGNDLTDQQALLNKMEVATTWSQIRDEYHGDYPKLVADRLAQYSRAQAPELYSGFPIQRGAPYLKRLWGLAKNWAMTDLVGGNVPEGFLKYSTFSKLAQATINEYQGIQNRANAVLHNQLSDYEKAWDAIPAADKKNRALEFYRAHAHEAPFTDPAWQEQSNLLKALTDERYNQIIAMGKQVHYFEHYFPGIWENAGKARKFVQSWMGKRPFEGQGKKYLRAKKYLTFEDAINAGLEPVSWNPIKQWTQYLESMDRYLVSQKTQNFWKDSVMMKFARNNNISKLPAMPEGLEWKLINDPLAEPKYVNANKEVVLPGKWYAIKPLADAMNEYMKPGWNRHLLYRGLRSYSNYSNMFQLGISAFHALDMTVMAAATDISTGMKTMIKAAQYGDIKKLGEGALRSTAALSLVSPIIHDMMVGAKLRAEWLEPGKHPELSDLVNRLTKTNTPFQWEKYYQEPSIDKFFKNWEQASLQHPIFAGKAALHFFPMLLRYSVKPIMDYMVPFGKIASQAKLQEYDMWLESKQDPRVASPEQRMIRAMEQQHRMDDVFGELQLDNRNWSKWIKDITQVAFRSGTWNTGTAALHYHAVVDFAKEPIRAAAGAGFELPDATGTIIGLAVLVAVWSSLLQLWMTGKPPHGKDFIAPQAPGVDAQGRQNRVWIKSYLSDDVNFMHDPGRTLLNKSSPALSDAWQFYNNRDFEGFQIRNPQLAPWNLKNLYSSLYWAFTNKVPMSITNLSRERGLGAGVVAQAGAFLGVQPAPGFVKNSPLQNRIDSILIPQRAEGPRSQDVRARSEFLRDLRERRFEGKLPDAQIYQMVKEGRMLPEDAKKLLSHPITAPLTQDFNQLNLKQQLWAWQVATKAEKDLLAPELAKKASQVNEWDLKYEHPGEAGELGRQITAALAQYPLNQIEARLYMEAGKERLDWARDHFEEQKAPHLKGMPSFNVRSLAGLPVPKAHGPAIGMADALNHIEVEIKNAQLRGDDETVKGLQTSRQQLLLQWNSMWRQAHPRAEYQSPIPLRSQGEF